MRVDSLAERWSGIGFILFSSILAWSVVMLNGSTVYGRQPVSMAYMLTPLDGGKEGRERRKREGRERRRWLVYVV